MVHMLFRNTVSFNLCINRIVYNHTCISMDMKYLHVDIYMHVCITYNYNSVHV